MEREIILTGIGGQGVQLAAQVLARAALLESREVMLLGTYGGTMRGGSTDATLVVGDRPIESPPVVERAGAAVALHHQFWAPVAAKLRPGALVLVNGSLFQGELEPGLRVARVSASEIAAELGAPLSASMVLLGAYAAASALVSLEGLVEGIAGVGALVSEAAPRAQRAGAAGGPCGGARAAGARVGRGGGVSEAAVVTRGTITVAAERCKGCELCIPACPPQVLRMSEAHNGLGFAYPELLPGCTGCGACLLVCPDFCFEVYKYEDPIL